MYYVSYERTMFVDKSTNVANFRLPGMLIFFNVVYLHKNLLIINLFYILGTATLPR